MNQKTIDILYEVYSKYMRETKGYFSCASKVEIEGYESVRVVVLKSIKKQLKEGK